MSQSWLYEKLQQGVAEGVKYYQQRLGTMISNVSGPSLSRTSSSPTTADKADKPSSSSTRTLGSDDAARRKRDQLLREMNQCRNKLLKQKNHLEDQLATILADQELMHKRHAKMEPLEYTATGGLIEQRNMIERREECCKLLDGVGRLGGLMDRWMGVVEDWVEGERESGGD
ncbi:hypothetical protein ACRE_020650 [Hapsidospora chrysogenum ATCC 11550]|uniref:Uncharacterized protein n=1 Tax=Hapsidospora chrysogenum (strain ATCC 11550 / CBS 779.69 / DSM 880 / IAM 14645 / JCM 23072 / IMI 49137) TaxID=857340 RepID=A0A086TCG8_HAPC1|nr:hypothetical protein ACRE_020650 [Hapsidospora chrysogenum ATCC 11550]